MAILSVAKPSAVIAPKTDFRLIPAQGNAAVHLARYGATWDSEPFRYAAIKRAFQRLEDTGALAQIDQLCFMALNEAGSLMSWITAGPNALNSSMLFGSKGFQGNGSTGWINTQFNPTAAAGHYSQNSAHVGVYVSDNVGPAGNGSIALGTQTTPSLATIWPLINTDGGSSAFVLHGATQTFVNPFYGQAGFALAQRSSANSSRFLWNGNVLFNTSEDPSSGLPNSVISIGRRGTNFSLGTYAGWSVGGRLLVSSGQEAALCEAFALMAAAFGV